MTKGGGLKRVVEKSARELLFGSRLFPIVRSAYQHVFDRGKFASRKRMLDFYAGFISRGDLVFDVGANIGEYSDAFLALGGRVIAIEPNPACCERLSMMARRGNLVVENCAVGDAEGTARLRICSEPGLSTLSNEWYETARASPIHGRASWPNTIEVRVTKLDSLAKKFGIPAFIKIDVEGFEDRVLAGMSFQPQALSFEFHFALPGLVNICLKKLASDKAYRFNYIVGNTPSFELAQWTDADELERAVLQANTEEEYGEIFCKKI